MIIVTGGAGFVGSNLVRRLNTEGHTDVLIVDNLRSPDKYRNLVDLQFADYMPKEDLPKVLESGRLNVKCVFHQGACTDTLESDGSYMMANNYEYSKHVLHYCLCHKTPLIYASSAAVYGHAKKPKETPEHEAPLNIYGYSKLAFDNYVRRYATGAGATVVGLRYFNVYGSGETHKGRMASMVLQLRDQVLQTGVAKLFGAAGGAAAGEQMRDFVYVEDLIDMNLFFWRREPVQTIVNAGSGTARTWNALGNAVIKALGKGELEYIDFPERLQGKYQFHTEADLTRLRSLGYDRELTLLEPGVARYLAELERANARFSP